MAIIHMDTEVTRGLAVRFREAALIFKESCSVILSNGNQVDWDGESSINFKSRLDANLRGLSAFNELISDSSRLIDEIEQWITTDQNAVQTFQDSQTIWQSIFASLAISMTQFPSVVRGLFNPYSLNEVWEYLQGTPSGKALEELAREHSCCFIFPDGMIVGDPNAATKYTVDFGETPKGAAGAHDRHDLSIRINEDLIRQDKVSLAGILGHEMQHAVDASQGKMPNYPKLSGNESEAELETIMAKYIDGRIHSEIRSYEIQENILSGTMYEDDGVLTGSERTGLLNYGDGFYKAGYEGSINALFDGKYTSTISVDPTTGELYVNLVPIAQPMSDFAF